ncbi:hypothetical protein [Halosegnis longus]|uniref:hypothetical protein n=1 Tax=Halosegnis longus TaxID=2216012 RepID=UPI00096A4270|nr:hypothetical protein [Salella cibi]
MATDEGTSVDSLPIAVSRRAIVIITLAFMYFLASAPAIWALGGPELRVALAWFTLGVLTLRLVGTADITEVRTTAMETAAEHEETTQTHQLSLVVTIFLLLIGVVSVPVTVITLAVWYGIQLVGLTATGGLALLVMVPALVVLDGVLTEHTPVSLLILGLYLGVLAAQAFAFGVNADRQLATEMGDAMLARIRAGGENTPPTMPV